MRVLVVDGSATTRRLLAHSLRGPDIDVVGEAPDAFTAQQLIAQHQPDVITLEIDMPQVDDGLAFLRHMIAHHPIPVIIVSSRTPAGSAASLEALRAGALDVVPKPRWPDSVTTIAGRIKQRIRGLREYPVRLRALPERDTRARLPAAVTKTDPVKGLIAIGTSTGGPQALELLLTRLPADAPPIVIVQHMPATFTRLFAERLNALCPMQVLEAAAGQELTAGVAYLAPGGRHLSVEQEGGRLRTATLRTPRVHHQRPAVDVLFHSLAKVRGVPIVGILLTGMGRDGADGMVALRQAGQPTIAEDSRSCVVFGMPREAIALGGASHVAPLEDIPALIFSCLRRAAEARHTTAPTA